MTILPWEKVSPTTLAPEMCLMMLSEMQSRAFITKTGGPSICGIIGNEWISASLLWLQLILRAHTRLAFQAPPIILKQGP
jgi:hypothetical protein